MLVSTARADDDTQGRAFTNRPDQVQGPQVHLIYAVPADGTDRRYDVDGSIASSFATAENWLAGQTGGRRLKLDTYLGQPDVTFVRLPGTDPEYASHGVYIRDALEAAVQRLGFNQPLKLYEVFYDGSATDCASGSWPPSLPGHVVGVYLKGTPPGAIGCDTQPFATSGQPAGYREMGEIHELMHALGFVPTCAPHFTLSGHVSDSPTDLLYAGDQPWDTAHMVLDYGRDDYFQANIPGCLDLSHSAFLDGGTDLPPAWFTDPGSSFAVDRQRDRITFQSRSSALGAASFSRRRTATVIGPLSVAPGSTTSPTRLAPGSWQVCVRQPAQGNYGSYAGCRSMTVTGHPALSLQSRSRSRKRVLLMARYSAVLAGRDARLTVTAHCRQPRRRPHHCEFHNTRTRHLTIRLRRPNTWINEARPTAGVTLTLTVRIEAFTVGDAPYAQAMTAKTLRF